MSSRFTIKKLIEKRLVTLDNITRNYKQIFPNWIGPQSKNIFYECTCIKCRQVCVL